MTLPKLEVIDSQTKKPLPFRTDEPDVQYNRLYHGKWAIRLTEQWSGQVGIVTAHATSHPLLLRRDSDNPNLWRIPRGTELEGQSNKERKKLEQEYDQTRGAAGRLRITLFSKDGRQIPGAPIVLLDVLPGNVTEGQLAVMVREIGLLALSAISQVAGKDLVTPTEDGLGIDVSGLIGYEKDAQCVAAEELQDAISVLRREIPRLCTRPLSSIGVKVGPTRVHKAAYNARKAHQANVISGKRTIVAQTRVESLDCSENRFVLYVLRSLCTLARNMQSRLEEEPPQIPLYPTNPAFTFSRDPREFLDEVKNSQKSSQTIREDLVRKRKETTAELGSSVRWLERMKREPFWLQISETMQPTYSLRLLGAPSYSAIYAHYCTLWGSSMTSIGQVVSLLDHIERGDIRCAWEVYELWCFVFIYYSLVREIRGLRPVHGELLERLTIRDGELHLPKNQPFILEGTLANRKPLRFRMWYEPQLRTRDGQDRKPDILLELCIDQAAPMYFVFDCKYRDYIVQKDNTLLDDIYGTAKLKYLESGLEFRDNLGELNIKASFILHTSDAIDYWGEIPAWTLLNDLFGSDKASQPHDVKLTDKIIARGLRLDPNDYAGHRFGAILMRPGKSTRPQDQFRRLIYLLLYYFADEVAYCPHCGTTATSLIDDNAKRGLGDYYLCRECGRFWVKHFCSGSGHHRLIKLGKDSFHKPTDNTGRWVYKCPECGDILSPKEDTVSQN